MKSKKEVVTLKNITKDYLIGEAVTSILKGISFTVHEGDFIAITGRSGSGKSTLMNILGLLDIPTDGTYLFNNINVKKVTENELAYLRNRELGFVFQSFNLLPRASALENVVLPATYAGTGVKERENKAKELLSRLGLENEINKRPNQMSGGQQQRVAIARALMNNPRVILADEPTGNLDTRSGNDVMDILKELNKEGKTVILITHEEDIAAQAKKVIKLVDGLLVN
jgi:putative ABC transport system ATP-binding protein